MPAKIIDGQQVAKRIRGEIGAAVDEFVKRTTGSMPGLGVVLVGDDPASAMYVRMKRRACERVGIRSEARILPAASGQQAVEDAVRGFQR